MFSDEGPIAVESNHRMGCRRWAWGVGVEEGVVEFRELLLGDDGRDESLGVF